MFICGPANAIRVESWHCLTTYLGTWRYGYLHSMRIDLLPARNCFITDLVGDLHDANPIRAGETRLILARISLSKSMSHSRIRESSSDELIADLESDLGNTLAPYLDVRVTYKHSGFLDYEYPFLTSDGMTSHTTQLQTDAKAIIRLVKSIIVEVPRYHLIASPLHNSGFLCNGVQISC